MPLLHIVLLKVKEDIWEKGNGKEELISKFQSLKTMDVVKETCEEIHVGPPLWNERSKGYNYAIYSRFKSMAEYERYRDHEDHKTFVRDVIVPNTAEPSLAYDWEI